MPQYEYKCVAGPKALGIKKNDAVDMAMATYAEFINSEAINGWEFHSIEPIAVETEQGVFKPTVTINYHMLIFKRLVQE